jgi:capsular polysaccharide biosynthesis protein
MEIMKTLRKRLALTLILLVLMLIVTAAAYAVLPSTYQAKSNVILLPSTVIAKTYGGNPYLGFDSTLNMTADVIRYEVTDARTGLALQAAGYTASYAITDAVDTGAPVLLITVNGSSKASVENTLSGVTNKVVSKLASQQADIPTASRITSQVITYTVTPSAVASKKLRSVLIVMVGGALVTVAIPLIVDATATRRNRRKGNRSEYDSDQRVDNEVNDYQMRDDYPVREPDYGRPTPDFIGSNPDVAGPYRNQNAPRPTQGPRGRGDVPAPAVHRPYN